MKIRAYYKPDKSVVFVIPSNGGDYETKVLKCAKESKLEGFPFDDIDHSDLPKDRKNRNLWVGEKGKMIKESIEQLI